MLVISQDLVGRAGIVNGKSCAVERDLVELVGEAPLLSTLAPKAAQSIPQRACDSLRLRLPSHTRELSGEFLGFRIADVESHISLLPYDDLHGSIRLFSIELCFG